MYLIKNRPDLESLTELVSLKNQQKAVRFQDKLSKVNFQKNMKKVFEPMTDIVKDVSNDKTKTKTETSIKNNIASDNINEKVLQIMDDNGLIVVYLSSPLPNLFKPENTSQFKLE